MRTPLSLAFVVASLFAADSEEDRSALMKEALAGVETTAVRFERMENNVLGARSLGSMAAVVCRYDKLSALSLFRRSIRLFGEAEATSDSKRQTTYVLRDAVRCDAALGRELNAEIQRRLKESDPRAALAMDVDSARAALETDLDGARSFGESAAERFGESDRNASMLFVGFLQRLREKDAAAADAIFLSTIASLGAAENPFPHLSALGSYVFMPAGSPQADHWRVSSFSDQRIYWYDEARAGTSTIARTFLSSAVTILSAPRSGDTHLPYRYALARHYHRLARTAAPDLVPVYDGLSAQLAAGVPDERLRRRAEQRAELSGTNPNILEDSYEKSTDVAERERYRLGLFSDSLREEDFDGARKWASEMDDIDARAQARQLANFFEAAKRLSNENTEGLRASVDEWQPGVQRALMYIGLAAGSEDSGVAMADLQMALYDAARFDRDRQPFILAAIAKGLARVDMERALTALQQAVDSFNALDFALELDTGPQEDTVVGLHKQGERVFEPYEIRASTRGFEEFLDNGYTQRRFRLTVPEVGGVELRLWRKRSKKQIPNAWKQSWGG